jgi:hypothetical protein
MADSPGPAITPAATPLTAMPWSWMSGGISSSPATAISTSPAHARYNSPSSPPQNSPWRPKAVCSASWSSKKTRRLPGAETAMIRSAANSDAGEGLPAISGRGSQVPARVCSRRLPDPQPASHAAVKSYEQRMQAPRPPGGRALTGFAALPSLARPASRPSRALVRCRSPRPPYEHGGDGSATIIRAAAAPRRDRDRPPCPPAGELPLPLPVPPPCQGGGSGGFSNCGPVNRKVRLHIVLAHNARDARRRAPRPPLGRPRGVHAAR